MQHNEKLELEKYNIGYLNAAGSLNIYSTNYFLSP